VLFDPTIHGVEDRKDLDRKDRIVSEAFVDPSDRSDTSDPKTLRRCLSMPADRLQHDPVLHPDFSEMSVSGGMNVCFF
jgi:hypothetical protein